MKKILLFLMIAALSCSVFAGCGDDENTNTTEAATNATTQAANIVTNDAIPDIEEITFNEYNAMTAEEQKAVMDSFEEVDEFFDWYEEIVEEHKKNPEGTEPGPIYPDAPDVSVPDKGEVTFMDYHAMSGEEQMAFINTFKTPADFVAWHTAARKAYEDSMIEIDGTEPIDLGEIVNGD